MRKAEEYKLILKMVIFDTKNHLLLIVFSDPPFIISTSEIQLDKSLGLASSIQKYLN